MDHSACLAMRMVTCGKIEFTSFNLQAKGSGFEMYTRVRQPSGINPSLAFLFKSPVVSWQEQEGTEELGIIFLLHTASSEP